MLLQVRFVRYSLEETFNVLYSVSCWLMMIYLLLQIRRKMTEIMVAQASSSDLKDLVAKFIPESIGKEIEKATSSIYPLQNVYIRKVKILKAPKFDLGKLMEVSLNYLFAFALFSDNVLWTPDCDIGQSCRFMVITVRISV